MKKKLLAVTLILGVILSFSGCINKGNNNEEKKLRVGVTINPIKDFTEAIGGDKVEVFSIIPNGSDAHSFDPKPKDLKDLINTDMFVYNGLQMEEWIDSVLGTIEGKNIKIVEASQGIDAINALEDAHEHSDDHEEGKEEHNHGDKDPHVWLSLEDATKEAENIKNALVDIDPENKDYYEKNYQKLKEDFSNLQVEYKNKFAEVKNKDFVTGHAAFAYLCRDFGLTQKSIADVFGEGELTPKNLEALIKYCRENNVKVVFNESVASSKESETLAKEVGARVEKIYSLETKEDNKSYIEGMKYNLDTIYNSLIK